MQFYVYVYRDPREVGGYQPIYVGKGSGKRSDRHWESGSHNPLLNLALSTYRANGLEPIREIVAWFEDEGAAYALEKELIKKYGRVDLDTGTLANRSSGGPQGWSNPSVETRAKLSAASRKRQRKKHSKETRAKISAAHIGKVPSQEARANMEAAQRGRKHSQETRARMSAAQRGKKYSPETLTKMSAAQLGKVMSQESRAKISKTMNGELGVIGVCRKGNKFRARITIKGRRRHLGCFYTIAEAASAYDAARIVAFGE